MSFLGVDVDDLRAAGAKCQEGAEETDQVISYLMILIAALEAASFFTGGASAAYARYLRTVVLPWLRQVSQALHLFAKVLGAHADAQDRASAGESVDWGALPTYTSPTNLPTSSTSQYPSVAPTAPAAPAPVARETTPATTPGAVPATAGTAPATAGTSGHYGGTIGTIDGTGATSGASGTGGTGSAGPGGSAGGSGTSGGTYPASSGGVDGTVGAGAPADTAGAPGAGSTTVPSLGTGSVDGGTTGNGGGSGAAVTSVAGSNDRGNAGTYTAMGSAGVLGAGAAAAAAAGAMGSKGGAKNDELESLIAKTGRGARGEDVTKVQQMLTAAGYDTKGADGQWGRNTEAAYQQWRAANPLQVAYGTGYTAPSGFDYSQIQGVKNNPNVTPEFLRRVEEVAQKNGTRPEWLMGVMSFETGGRFGADTPNSGGGSARGLIQFLPSTARDLNTTSEALVRMTPTQQLDYVDAYLQRPWRRGHHDTLEGLYTSVLSGTPRTDADGVMWRAGSAEYRDNRGLDSNRDSAISVREATDKIRRAMRVTN